MLHIFTYALHPQVDQVRDDISLTVVEGSTCCNGVVTRKQFHISIYIYIYIYPRISVQVNYNTKIK